MSGASAPPSVRISMQSPIASVASLNVSASSANRPLRAFRELFDEHAVAALVPTIGAHRVAALGLDDLDEAFVAFAEHVGEREYVFVRHRVVRHRLSRAPASIGSFKSRCISKTARRSAV